MHILSTRWAHLPRVRSGSSLTRPPVVLGANALPPVSLVAAVSHLDDHKGADHEVDAVGYLGEEGLAEIKVPGEAKVGREKGSEVKASEFR